MVTVSRRGGSGLLFEVFSFPFFPYICFFFFLPSCTIIELFSTITSEQGVGNGNQSVGDTTFCHFIIDNRRMLNIIN